jgi:HlyD family secretion protein
MKKKKVLIGVSLGIVLLIALIGFKACKNDSKQVSVETTKVKKGTVSNIVTATGTVQAIKTVTVGCQVSGKIDKLYADYNSHVKSGDLLAEIDKRTLLTSLEDAQASLDNAKAEVTYQTANYNRVKALIDKSLVAQNDYDLALYNFTKAKASFKTAQLQYDRAKINLNYASVYSPIDGVILSRAVSEGQTVTAGFSTPTLFSIANDLTQMQVEAAIDEADIGKVKMNQRVTFTVDAFSDLKFDGKIIQVRLQPTTTSNVVTYTVIVKAPNPEQKLMPGMTASITIYVEEAVDVMTVASKALRFTPDQAVMDSYLSGLSRKDMPKPPGGEPPANMPVKPASQSTDSIHPVVWVKNGTDIHPVPVKIGINDELNAQVLEGLKEGDEVVIAMKEASTASDKATTGGSPFMPKPPSSGKKNNRPPQP